MSATPGHADTALDWYVKLCDLTPLDSAKSERQRTELYRGLLTEMRERWGNIGGVATEVTISATDISEREVMSWPDVVGETMWVEAEPLFCAVNGVDINALIKGAATQRTVQNFAKNSGTGGVGGTKYGAQTVAIAGDTVECAIAGTFSATNGGGAAKSATMNLYVDGAKVQSFPFFGGVSGCWQWTVAGLSIANHTFDWRVIGDDGDITGGTGAASDGQTIVADLRR